MTTEKNTPFVGVFEQMGCFCFAEKKALGMMRVGIIYLQMAENYGRFILFLKEYPLCFWFISLYNWEKPRKVGFLWLYFT